MNQPQEPIHFAYWYNKETAFCDRFPQLLMPPTEPTIPYYLDPQADKLMLENLSVEQIIERQECFAMQEFMALYVELESPIGNLTQEQAKRLLAVRDWLVNASLVCRDREVNALIGKAYQELYAIVVPGFMVSNQPWEELEKLAKGGRYA